MQISKRLEKIKLRLSSVAAAALLVVGMAVPAWAVDKHISDSSFVVLQQTLSKSSLGYEMEVHASKFTSSQQELWKTIMQDVYDPDRVVIFSFLNCASNYSHTIGIASFDRASLSSRNPTYQEGYTGVILKSNDTVVINIKSSDGFVYDSLSYSSSDSSIEQGYVFTAANTAYWAPSYDLDSRLPILADLDTLIINDDLDEESSSSSIPEPPPLPETDFPVIGPTDNEFVPYDTTIWNTFCDWVKNSIGSSTNVAFLILGVLIGIFIIRRIIKMFTG